MHVCGRDYAIRTFHHEEGTQSLCVASHMKKSQHPWKCRTHKHQNCASHRYPTKSNRAEYYLDDHIYKTALQSFSAPLKQLFFLYGAGKAKGKKGKLTSLPLPNQVSQIFLPTYSGWAIFPSSFLCSINFGRESIQNIYFNHPPISITEDNIFQLTILSCFEFAKLRSGPLRSRSVDLFG